MTLSAKEVRTDTEFILVNSVSDLMTVSPTKREPAQLVARVEGSNPSGLDDMPGDVSCQAFSIPPFQMASPSSSRNDTGRGVFLSEVEGSRPPGIARFSANFIPQSFRSLHATRLRRVLVEKTKKGIPPLCAFVTFSPPCREGAGGRRLSFKIFTDHHVQSFRFLRSSVIGRKDTEMMLNQPIPCYH